MNKLNYTLGLIALMTIFASCSVEKRVHRNGYHVEWHGRNKQVDQTTAIAEQKDVTPSENESKTQTEVQDVALAPIAAVNAERPLEKEKKTKSDDAIDTGPSSPISSSSTITSLSNFSRI